ncbi:MAG: hypothetical protein QM630_00055 [Microbacterium sp.]
MFGSKKNSDDVVGRIRPELSRKSLGVGPEFPGIVPNPDLSRAAKKRNAELRTGTLAIGTLVDWREINNNPRIALMLDVDTLEGVSFRGIADEDFTVTETARLAPGQRFPVRYRPATMDHYVALAKDIDPAQTQALIDSIERREVDG